MKKQRTHGTVNEYSRHGCRCTECITAMCSYRTEYRRQVIAGERGKSVLNKYRAGIKKANDRKSKDRSPEWLSRRANYLRKYQSKRRKLVADMKRRPCIDCGKRFPPECMDFDHRPGEEKNFCVAGKLTLPWDRVVSEIAKCDVVCSNCHRTRTIQRREARRLNNAKDY